MSDLTRITIALRPAAVRALDRLTPAAGTRTGAVDRALRLAAELDGLADADGAVTVLDSDGERTRLVIL